MLRRAEENLDPKKNGLTFGGLIETTDLDRSILSQYLRDLQEMTPPLILRTPDRKYHLLEGGKEVLSRRDDVAVILRSGKVLRREIQPDPKITAPRIFPIEASVYVSGVEKLVDETAEDLRLTRGSLASKDEAQHALLAEMADPIALRFDTIFTLRFWNLAADWFVYDIQQMQPAKRRNYLRKLHRLDLTSGRTAAERRQDDRFLDDIEHDYMSRKLPEGGPPPLTFENLLNFEAAYVVSVPRETLKKDPEKIRNRFATHLLTLMVDPTRMKPPNLWVAMAEAGIITSEESEEYYRAKGPRQRERVLRELWKKHFLLAWGKNPEQVYGKTGRVHRVEWPQKEALEK